MRTSQSTKKNHGLVKALIIVAFLTFTAIPAGAEQCHTGCKEGPKEYNTGITWMCTYDREGNKLGYGFTDVDSKRDSVCQLTIRGQFKNVAIDFGHYQNIKECMEELCIPKATETCGEVDRCSDTKNWRKY